jgi:predicted RND superfamily exporter protein
VRVENDRVGATLAGTQLFSVVIDGHQAERVVRLDTLNAMESLQRFVAAQPGVDKVNSVLDYLHTLRETLDPTMAGRPFTDARAAQQLLLLLDPRDLERNLNRDYSRANLTVHTRLSESEEVRQFVERVETFAQATFPPGVQVHVTGTVVLLNRSAVALAEGQYFGLRMVFTVLTIAMILLFRSVRLGLLSMIPNVVPILALFGVMGWASIDLNIATSLIAVIAVGIAVDDTIHYLTTFRAELAAGYDPRAAVARTLHVVGRPILVTSVALCTGFLVPWFSAFQPIQHFGVLTSFTMAVALLADLLLLPALLTAARVGEAHPPVVTAG